MSDEFIALVNRVVVPAGLISIMFSMGLSLRPRDFAEVVRNPRAVFGGLAGQLVLLPPLAVFVIWLFRLPPAMATGLFILAICPGGITSNAITYAAKANVALAVVLTTVSSLITVFTIPPLMNWALAHYFVAGEVPPLSVPKTMLQLAQMTLAPILTGMLLRHLWPDTAQRLSVWLRPASLVVLIAVIAFAVLVSIELVVTNLLYAGPAAFVLNAASMALGLGIAWLLRLDRNDSLTVAIEVGIHNATMATFISLSVLKEMSLAITPTIYGIIMVANAGLLVRWMRRRAAAAIPAAP
jgi:bile acid:Na+ symporter, BASS family